MNYLLWTMMTCAIVTVTVRGQYVVNAPAAVTYGSSGSWLYNSPVSSAIDNSNTTCVETNVNGSPGQYLIVIYSTTQFVPSTIYLVGPSPVTNDMTLATTISSVSWGMAGGASNICNPSVSFSLTNNVASWTCPVGNKGTQMTLNISTVPPTRNVSICNVIVYSFDAQFSTPANGPFLVALPAYPYYYGAESWVASSPASNLVDNSNTTCVMTDVNVPTSSYGISLSVSYAASFVPSTIYLVGPSVVPYDMTVAGNIESVEWISNNGFSPCTAGTTFSSTNNVASYTCWNVGRGSGLIVRIKGNVQINLVFCNVLVYSNDANVLFSGTTTSPRPTTAAAAAVNPGITQSPTSKWRLTGIIDYLLESIKLSMAEIRSLDGH